MKMNIPCRSIPMPYYTYVNPEPDYSTLPLTFKAENNAAKVKFYRGAGSDSKNLRYKIGKNGDWADYTLDTWIQLSQGQFVELSSSTNTLNRWNGSSNNYFSFNISGGDVAVYGQLYSLINYQNTTTYLNLYNNLFKGITNCSLYAHNLILPQYLNKGGSFAQFFRGSTALRTGPILPLLSLPNDYYYAMFYGCTNLSSKIRICATSIYAFRPLHEMFYNCSSLKCVEVDFTSWNEESASQNWMSNVAANGTFIKPQALNYNTTKNKIPSSWKIVNKDSTGKMYIANNDGSNGAEVTVDNQGNITYV